MDRLSGEKLAREISALLGIDGLAIGAVNVAIKPHEKSVCTVLAMAHLSLEEDEYYSWSRARTRSGKTPADIILNGTEAQIHALAQDMFAVAMPQEFFDYSLKGSAPLMPKIAKREASVIKHILEERLYSLGSLPALINPLDESDTCSDVTSALLQAITRLVEEYDGEDGQMLLCLALQDPSVELRRATADLCAGFVGYRVISSALHGARFDPESSVRRAALESLAKFRVSPHLAALIADFLGDEDVKIRIRAVTILSGFSKLPEEFDYTFEKALSDTSSAVRALATAWKKNEESGY